MYYWTSNGSKHFLNQFPNLLTLPVLHRRDVAFLNIENLSSAALVFETVTVPSMTIVLSRHIVIIFCTSSRCISTTYSNTGWGWKIKLSRSVLLFLKSTSRLTRLKNWKIWDHFKTMSIKNSAKSAFCLKFTSRWLNLKHFLDLVTGAHSTYEQYFLSYFQQAKSWYLRRTFSLVRLPHEHRILTFFCVWSGSSSVRLWFSVIINRVTWSLPLSSIFPNCSWGSKPRVTSIINIPDV